MLTEPSVNCRSKSNSASLHQTQGDSEKRAGQLWHDVVHQRVEDRHLLPLQVEDLALIETCLRCDDALARALRNL